MKKETEDTLTILFKQPALKKIKYQAGQYLTLIFRINGRRYLRPYSFSSAPGIDSTLNVTIKRVPGGVISNHILDKVQPGDIIEVLPPMGNFILKDPHSLKKKHIVLWGCGSGITPLISIAKYALYNRSADHISLIYGNRNFESTIFRSEIEDLKSLYRELFSVWHFHTKNTLDSTSSYVVKGRINPSQVLSTLNKEGNLNNTTHYICGPEGLKESVKYNLLKSGVEPSLIYTEDFEATRRPEDFREIVTRNIIFEHDGQTTTLEVVKGKSILEACLDSGIETNYSCQIGDCMLCKARLISGEVKVIGMNKSPEELDKHECLMCCSFPLGDNVKIIVESI